MYAKVIVVCANTDRVHRCKTVYPHHPQHLRGINDLHRMWSFIHAVDMTQDAGVEMDTLIVCNGDEAYEWWKDKEGKSKNGRFIILKRPNDGGSFAGYNFAFRNSNYEGYLFTEEDILVYGENYLKRMIEQFNATKDAGFMCLIDASKGRLYPVHCHGGVGYTSRENILKVVDENGDLPHPKMKGWNQREAIVHGESPFTNCYLKKGMNLIKMEEHKKEWCRENFAKSYYMMNATDYAEVGLRYASFIV